MNEFLPPTIGGSAAMGERGVDRIIPLFTWALGGRYRMRAGKACLAGDQFLPIAKRAKTTNIARFPSDRF